jgi:hypothetical protein
MGPINSFVEPTPANVIHRISSTVWLVLGVPGLALLVAGLYLLPDITPVLLAGLGLGLPAFLLVWSLPELGLLAFILITASVIPITVLDIRLPVGGGLKLRDIALLGMLGISGFQMLLRRRALIPWRPVGTAMAAFLGIAVFSALYGKFWQGVSTTLAFNELRNYIFYAAFFVTGWTILQRKQLMFVLVGLFIIADVTAGVITLQQFIGSEHRLLVAMSDVNWKVWESSSSGAGLGSVRIIPPGHTLVYVMMIVASGLTVLVPRPLLARVFYLMQAIYLNVGLLLTFTRAQYLAVAIAYAFILVVLAPAYKAQLIRLVAIAIPVLLLGAGILGKTIDKALASSGFVGQVATRVESMLTLEETLGSDSMEWRAYETEEALRSIRENPLLGVGMGNSYRERTLLQGEVGGGWAGRAGDPSRFTRFIHNSFLTIAVKMGLPGLFVFLWMCLCTFIYGWKVYKRAAEPAHKAIVLAVLAGFLGLLQWSVFHVQLVQVEHTVVVGLALGLIASIAYIENVSRIGINRERS